MKTVRVAVVVALVLTFICFQESSADPNPEVQELEGTVNNDNPAAEEPETAWSSWTTPTIVRNKRGTKCKICCGCCTPGVCGLCCRF